MNARALIALALALFTVPFTAVAPAVAAGTSAPALHAGTQFARLGGFRSRGTGGFGFGRRSPYRYHRRGHPFLRGLFFGWLLSHFFGGGFPLFPIFLILIAWMVLRGRRRRRAAYPGW